ncbi:hypothetical protein RQ831_19360 [Roseomonas gilardii]|uniref:Uncharacterized protein n=1 Tax=Roseomonas gilardii TaxID=257708 RepID=A0ABU3MKL3_9PROT|nr:hypothetical protein [Roseomonas gilardii]MDT8333215.1 hypothetical protein [Roseomonas gilardii]PZR07753.1 MAG: hypothetical protein DI532_23215 [Azospirillum brasilense]
MTEDLPAHWPKGVRPIDVGELDLLGIDSSNKLYWDGKEINYKLRLNWWQNIIAGLAAIASLATIASGVQNASLFLCARNVSWLGCPAGPSPVPNQPASPVKPETKQTQTG